MGGRWRNVASVFALYGAVLVIAFAQRRDTRARRWYFVVSWVLILGTGWGPALFNFASTNVPHLGGFLVGLLLGGVWAARDRLPERAFVATASAIAFVALVLAADRP